uniref:Uncharacterized protein n=1 Tax=Arcella intermedia TaxID=1963864 RepID=A0A6B2LSJ4_9EUKA
MSMTQTALMVACQKGHAECVSILLNFKNNLNTHPSHQQRPPLWHAVNREHKAVVKVTTLPLHPLTQS